jgi:hypothetical protein
VNSSHLAVQQPGEAEGPRGAAEAGGGGGHHGVLQGGLEPLLFMGGEVPVEFVMKILGAAQGQVLQHKLVKYIERKEKRKHPQVLSLSSHLFGVVVGLGPERRVGGDVDPVLAAAGEHLVVAPVDTHLHLCGDGDWQGQERKNIYMYTTVLCLRHKEREQKKGADSYSSAGGIQSITRRM